MTEDKTHTHTHISQLWSHEFYEMFVWGLRCSSQPMITARLRVCGDNVTQTVRHLPATLATSAVLTFRAFGFTLKVTAGPTTL